MNWSRHLGKGGNKDMLRGNVLPTLSCMKCVNVFCLLSHCLLFSYTGADKVHSAFPVFHLEPQAEDPDRSGQEEIGLL